MNKLVLHRHGESQWNLENRFTGWKDVDLTKKGIIYLEINPNFTKEFNQILTNYSINHVNFKDDFRGKKRFLKIVLNERN